MAIGDTKGTPEPSSSLGLVSVAWAVVLGVSCDRWIGPPGSLPWAALAALLSGFAWWQAIRSPRAAHCALLLAAVALGATWHHTRWADRRPDDLSHAFDTLPAPRPAWLRGVLLAVPEWSPPDANDQDGRTRTVLAVTHASDGLRWVPASGRVRLTVTGRRTAMRMGDPISIAGTLEPIPGPRNPGEFDLRALLRADGIRLRLHASDPRALEPWKNGPWWPLTRALGNARHSSARRLARVIPESARPLAAALLLGRREAVDPETDDAFARTGTTHLLAISGLHLQVLAVSLLALARGIGLPRRPAYLLVLFATVGYALLVGLMPSVGRSAAMTTAACLARLSYRPTGPADLVAAAALGVLAWNPSDLFDVGAQLSFLGVAALLWGAWPLEQWWRARTIPTRLDALEASLAPRWKRARAGLARGLGALLRVSVVVWLITAPMVAWKFHLVSPIGVLLNVPLIPITSMALGLAGLSLAGAPVWPWIAQKSGQLCGLLLDWTSTVVHKGADFPGGHLFTMGPPLAWVSGFYLILLGFTVSPRARRPCAIVLAGWLAILPAWQWSRGRLDAPEAEILAVDHGLAVFARGRPGHALLYDCGRMRDPRVGRRVIAPALWARGVHSLDAVVLSHADFDHASGLLDLLDRLPVRALLIAPGFARSGDAWAAHLLAEVHRRQIPIRFVSAGDPIPLGPELRARVLHPPRDGLLHAPDNAQSVVLAVEAGGRRLLLPGDLEGVGLSELIAQPPLPTDVLLSPHHGSRAANPPRLYSWANPKTVVVSQAAPPVGADPPLESLSQAGLPVLRTSELGAIRVRWTPDGLHARGFLDDTPMTSQRIPHLAASAVPELTACLGRSALRENGDWLRSPRRCLSPFSRHGRRPEPFLCNWPHTLPGQTLTLRGLFAVLGLALGLGGFVALAVIVWGAWTLVRPGGRRLADPPAPEPTPWEPITATTPDSLRLAGAWRRADGPPTGRTLLLIHGLGEDRHAMRSRAEALAAIGWNVALLDSRNRGQSQGSWTTFGAREAADLAAWLDALAPRVAPLPLLPAAWGRSMGAAIALRFQAETDRLAAVVLEAPYDDLRISTALWLARRRLPRWLAFPMLRFAAALAGTSLDRPRPIDLAPLVKTPTLILAGENDAIAPASGARRLALALAGPTEIHVIPNARHNDIFDVAGTDLTPRIAHFLNSAISPRSFPSSPSSPPSD